MTGKQRLKVLANYLRSGAVDNDKFDMEAWPQCAIGEASRIPSLEKEGLELVEDSSGALFPSYNDEQGFGACATFFSIPYDKAKYFFGPTQRSAARVGSQLLSYLRRH